jgi:hypothetical protein
MKMEINVWIAVSLDVLTKFEFHGQGYVQLLGDSYLLGGLYIQRDKNKQKRTSKLQRHEIMN